jgi:hypothetical protein
VRIDFQQTSAPFTVRLIKWLLIFFVSLGASYLAFSSRGLLPSNIMRATVLQAVLYSILGLVKIALVLLTMISGLIVFSLLLRAHETGAKILNEVGAKTDK